MWFPSLISMIQAGEFPERKKPHSDPKRHTRDTGFGGWEKSSPAREHRAHIWLRMDTCYKDTLLAPSGWPGVRHDFNSTRVSLRLILRN